MDKVDVVDALAGALDGSVVEGLGAVLATADSEEDGTLVLEVATPDDEPVEVFMVRVTKYRSRSVR